AAHVEGQAEAGDQAAVLGDVVGGDADGLGGLGEEPAVGRVAEHGAVAGGAGVAARAAVGLDDVGGHSSLSTLPGGCAVTGPTRPYGRGCGGIPRSAAPRRGPRP